MKAFKYSVALIAVLVFMSSCSTENEQDELLETVAHTVTIDVADEDGQPISAEAQIFVRNNTGSRHALRPGVNRLTLSNSEETFGLRILKEGFEPYETEVSLRTADLLNGRVLHVKLKSVLALTIETYADDEFYAIELDGSGSITIVWPDGSTETSTMPASFGKEFDAGSNRPVLLKGDIKRIKKFNAFGYGTAITNILGLKNMTELEVFYPGMLSSPQRLDLGHNRKLTHVDLFSATLPQWLKLPPHHKIVSFTLSLNDRNITAAEVNEIIDNIYKNSVRQKITGGWLALTDSDAPSSKTTTQIEVLENKYLWQVELNY